MATTFFIEGCECLSVKQALEILPDLEQFSIDEFEEEFTREDFLDSFLDEYECIRIGTLQECGRGFELGYLDGYEIRITTPATRSDWELTLEFVSALASKFNCEITAQNEFKEDENLSFTARSVLDYDFVSDIKFGLEVVKSNTKDGHTYTIYGLTREVTFNENIIGEILSAKNSIDAFSEFVTDIQNIDAYDAAQQFYDTDDGQTFGEYVLTQLYPTIMPILPSVERANMQLVSDDELSFYRVVLVAGKGEGATVVGTLNYDEFTARLPKEKYKFTDANHVLIKPLSRGEMAAMIGIGG